MPIAIIFLYSFNAPARQSWPIRSWTTDVVRRAFGQRRASGSALSCRCRSGIGATIVAIVLGSLAALAVHRFRFFGRETISFALVLPIALPGIVTGIALHATINSLGIPFGPLTIIVGHATFCVVVVYNNVIARLRRSSRDARRGVMRPRRGRAPDLPPRDAAVLRTALVAAGLLAFALSFDEIIVTNFTAGHASRRCPIWIFNNLKLPNQRPIVNVVAVVVILVSIDPGLPRAAAELRHERRPVRRSLTHRPTAVSPSDDRPAGRRRRRAFEWADVRPA